jgi:pimeloyl-ACP methyl ester carboxylesterase
MDDWIFLRGLVRECRHWGSFVQEFAQIVPDARVVLLDLPGNGALCGQASPVNVAKMVEAYRTQLRAMGKAAPYRILAVSMGAMVAAEWSHRYPDEVAMQVLINTSMRPFSAFYRRLRPANYVPLLWNLITRANAMAWERTVLRLTTNHPHAEVLPYWCKLREQYPVGSRNMLRQLLAAAIYRASTAPPAAATLLLASANDHLVSVECSLALAAHWQVPLVVHPTAGHDLTLDDGQWVAQQVQAWVNAQMYQASHDAVTEAT